MLVAGEGPCSVQPAAPARSAARNWLGRQRQLASFFDAAPAMRVIDRVLTPRGRPVGVSTLALPGDTEPAALYADENSNPVETPRSKGSRLGKLLSRVLTPRRHSGNADGSLALPASLVSPRPRSAGAIDAQRTVPGLNRAPAGLATAQLRLADSPAPSPASIAHVGARDGDTASEAGSDLSSLDGFGEYARIHGLDTEVAEREGSCSGGSVLDQLP